MLKRSTVLNEISSILKNAGLEDKEAEAEAKLIVTTVCGVTYEQIVTGTAVVCDKAFEIAKKIALKRAQTRAPIQHLLGCANFMGLKFKVNENVLIPRDETEILVRETERIIKKMPDAGSKKVKILDIGTGSGIIPIMLAKIFGNKIEALGADVSTKALSIAIENAQTHLEPNLALFRKSNLFLNIHENEIFDIIVSNPPYIPSREMANLQKEVLDFEPHLALFAADEGDEEGVEFYRKIIMQGKKHLKKSGYILFELGINQADIVSKMLSEQGFSEIETIKDLANIERVIKAKN